LKSWRIVNSKSFKYFRIKEPPVSVLWKKTQNQTTTNSLQTMSKTLKNRWFSGKNHIVLWPVPWLFFVVSANNIYHSKTSSSNFGRTDKWMNVYIPSLITKKYVSHSKNHPTLPKTCITRSGKVLIKSPKHESKVYLGTRSGQGQTKKRGST